MTTRFHHLAFVKHTDAICLLNRTQSVSNRDGRFTFRGARQRRLHQCFGLRVECRRCFVE